MDDRNSAVATQFDADQLPADVLRAFHQESKSAALAIFVGKYGLNVADAELLLGKYSQKNSLSSGWKEVIVRWLDRLLLAIMAVSLIFGLLYLYIF